MVRFFIKCPFFKLAVKPQGVKGDLSLLQGHRLSIADTWLCVLAIIKDNSTPKAPRVIYKKSAEPIGDFVLLGERSEPLKKPKIKKLLLATERLWAVGF
ncbi:hypothetical protein ASV60_10545 [Pasteurella multocida]|nr:hypothetical protein ASV60_10545 [Pasteurella multocida]